MKTSTDKSPNETEIINRYFLRNTDNLVKTGIGDDAAVVETLDNYLVVTTDTLVVGVHFEPDSDATSLGHKALAVSLSDLAAMGASPRWALLSLTLPTVDETWLHAFADGFFRLADQHQVSLIGGDTTVGALVITVQLMGSRADNRYMKRQGATVGDGIYVTGRIAEVGLIALCADRLRQYPDAYARCEQRKLRPIARVPEGEILVKYANAAIDISDGVLKDLTRLLEAGAVGGKVEIDDIPVAPELDELCPTLEERLEVLVYGDDYELLFTMKDHLFDNLTTEFSALHTAVTRIGTVCEGNDLSCTWRGAKVDLPEQLGYDHFT